MRKAIFCALLFVSYHVAFSQTKQNVVDNSTVAFDVVRYFMRITTNGVVPAKFVISVKVPSEEKEKFKQSDKFKLLELLSNEETDWATNLLLYDVFEKDASILLLYDREEWVYEAKETDIEYWRKTLR
jgi:hypothetical protein